MTEYRVLLFRCPKCDRPIPVVSCGALPAGEIEVACLERFVCRWNGQARLDLAEQTLAVHWPDKAKSPNSMQTGRPQRAVPNGASPSTQENKLLS